MKKKRALLLVTVLALSASWSLAQESDDHDVDGVTGATRQAEKTEGKTNALSRLHIGGYGEAVMTRNFYSQSFNRYKMPERYADDKNHGRFDLPHICLNLGYDFGKGWTMGVYMVVSFLTVVITYFGVNYLLGGMHSYA